MAMGRSIVLPGAGKCFSLTNFTAGPALVTLDVVQPSKASQMITQLENNAYVSAIPTEKEMIKKVH